MVFACSVFQVATIAGSQAAEPVPFGEIGKFNMLYDVRQRPQTVYLHDRLYIVYNGDAKPSKNGNGSASPMLITYDAKSRTFSESANLGKSSSDHHYTPIIWADEKDTLHVLYGCHKTPGTHLISTRPVRSGTGDIAWQKGPMIASKLSYPTVYRIYDDHELIYYRTDGHSSSWAYKISKDNGRTWSGPENDVTNLDALAYPEWSSYQNKLPSRDGKYLHVVYTDYDDVKSNDPQRLFNPRYGQPVANGWKYNLSYLRIDLETYAISNADGKVLRAPIDLETSKTNCQIWDTAWRGAGVPPTISLDEQGEPVFLHALSGDDLESHDYYYVRRDQGQWKQTRICESNHQWNSCYLSRDDKGGLHAYVIVGEGYLDGGYMDGHGGGRIEEWVSYDRGDSWKKKRDLTPDSKRYSGWRFNNIQPVLRPDGSAVDGMLIFYGWKDENAPEARAFLLHE